MTDPWIEWLAKILHESGREAVKQHKVVNDLGKPFLSWDEISEDAKEGRRMMARFLFAHPELEIRSKTARDAGTPLAPVTGREPSTPK